jgi:anti-sigma B factor antagonist
LSSSEQDSGLTYVSIAAQTLLIDIGPEFETAYVRLGGELDIASAPTLDAELERLIEGPVATVIVDLSALDFIDASGLHCLMRAARLSRRAHGTVHFIRGSGEADRLLRVSGAGKTLPMID